MRACARSVSVCVCVCVCCVCVCVLWVLLTICVRQAQAVVIIDCTLPFFLISLLSAQINLHTNTTLKISEMWHCTVRCVVPYLAVALYSQVCSSIFGCGTVQSGV